MATTKPWFLYHGSTVPHLTRLSPRRRTAAKEVRGSAVYASAYPGVAAIFGLPWDDTQATFREQGLLFTFTLRKPFPVVPVTIYQVSAASFRRVVAGSDTEWVTRKEVRAGHFCTVDPLAFAAKYGVTIIDRTR